MENFSTRQLAAIAAGNKTVYWTFRVTDIEGSTYYWSTGTVPSSGNEQIVQGIIQAPDAYDNMEWEREHEFKITNFSGISLRRNKSESGIHAPNDLDFTIINNGNEYNYESFLGGTVRINLIIKDDVGSELCGAWRFRIKGSSPYNQLIDISCEDFLQEFLKGTYPNTQLVDELYPSIYGTSQDTLCVAEPYGTCYIPLRSFYANSDRHYLLGPDTYTYDITEVRSPRECGSKITWLSTEYDFDQIDYQGWKLLQPKIAESGGVYHTGIFMSGSNILDVPTKFSRSDTVNLTNPADVIRRVLWNMGVKDYDIDVPSFDESKATYISWGLEWNFAFWYHEDRTKVLSTLLAMCGSCLVVGERITLQVLTKVSKRTITEADVIKAQEVGMDTFKYSATLQESASDCGYVAYQIAGESQDEFLSALVPAKTTRLVIDSETIQFPGVQNTTYVQKLGTLYYQRKFLKAGDVSYNAKGTCLALRPDDVITINYADYGGTYSVLIDDITIQPDITVKFKCQKFSASLDDWNDIVPGEITPGTDIPVNPYSVVIAGPDGTSSTGSPPNVLPGRLRIGDGGDYILIDPAPPIRISVYQYNTERLRVGNLRDFVGFADDTMGLGVGNAAGTGFRAWFTAQGCFIGNDTRYMQYTVEEGLVVRGDISADDITTGTLNLSLLVVQGSISGGSDGIIGGGSITGFNIQAGSITANEISSDYVYTGVLQAWQVNAVDIDAYSITTGILDAARIAAGSITAVMIASDYIYTGVLNAAQVNAVEINAASIKAGILNVDRILARSINGQHIGQEQIGGGGGEQHICPGTIIGPDIAFHSITADHIVAGSITANEIASNFVYAGEINATQITAGQIAASQIASDFVYTGDLNAAQIKTGFLNVDLILAKTIVAQKIYGYDPVTDLYSDDLIGMSHLQEGSATASIGGYSGYGGYCPPGGTSGDLVSATIETEGNPVSIIFTGVPMLPNSTQVFLGVYRNGVLIPGSVVNHLVNYEQGVSQLTAALAYYDVVPEEKAFYTYSVRGINPSSTGLYVQSCCIILLEMRR